MRAGALLLLLAAGACAPREFAPATPADAASPANGTWAGRVECIPGGGPRLFAELPSVTIEDGAFESRDSRAQLSGRFDATGRGDVVGYIRTFDGEWIPLGMDVQLAGDSLAGLGRYESRPKGSAGGRSGRPASGRPDDPRGPCTLALARR